MSDARAANGGMTLQPVGGDGVLSRRGALIVLCAAGVRTGAVLAAHAEVAAAGGDGTALADRLGELLTDGTVDAVAFGPSGPTTTVAVFGHAWADVATVHGEQRLALKEAAQGVRSSLAGTIVSIRAGLGDAEGAGEPQRWGDLESGVVHARGLVLLPSGAPRPADTEPLADTPAVALGKQVTATAEQVVAVPAVEAPADATLAPAAEPPAPTEPAQPVPDVPTIPPPAPAAVGAAEPAVAQPEIFAPPAIDRSQPFSSVVFVQASGSAPQVEERAPLPVVDMPLPAPAPHAAAAPHPTPSEGVSVLGVYCKNGHFDDPGARYCAICGISMAQLTLVPRPGPRPPLGVLVLDDGSIFSLDADYVIGRNPARVGDVVSGHARALRLDDRQGLLSRAHARVRLDGWQVQIVDLGSVNGTGVLVPGTQGWQRLPANTPVAIRPGTEVGVGQRKLRYESHRNT